MIRQLFSCFLGLVAATAVAVEPTEYPGLQIYCLSSQGNWGVSASLEEATIIDFSTGEVHNLEKAFPGLGNCISDTGILVGECAEAGGPGYYDGKWHSLPLQAGDLHNNLVHGITNDGSRICGQAGRQPMGFDATSAMCVPVVWCKGADGYDPYIELPYPETDVEGLVPQYVTAVAISNDGRKITGQVRSNSGRYNVPIMYEQDAEGNWSWRYLWKMDLGENLPTPPGEKPEVPDPTDFMSPEDAEEYTALLESGTYPDPEDYMNSEEIEEWTRAWEEYNAKDEAWWNEYTKYVTALEEIITVPGFDFNNVLMSANGRYVVSTEISYMEYEIECKVYVCDTENDDTWTVRSGAPEMVLATFVGNGGEVLASSPFYDSFRQAWISLGANEDFIPFQDYVAEKSQPLYEWMDTNMRHDHPCEDGSWSENGWCIGSMCASSDLSVFAAWEANAWDNNSQYYYFSYFLPMDATSSLSPTVVNQKDGAVYNLQGIKIANSIEEVESSGIYISNGGKIKR